MNRVLSVLLVFAPAAPALAAGAEGGANPFAGTLYQGIAAIVVFLTVFFVLKAKAWPKILEGIQAREGKIRSDLEQAEQAAQRAEETLKEYRTRLAAAQQEGQKLIDKSRDDARRVAEQLRQQTEAEITLIRQRAESEMTAAKQRAINELYAEAGLVATHIAGRILEREITAEDQKNLIDQTLAELGRTRQH